MLLTYQDTETTPPRTPRAHRRKNDRGRRKRSLAVAERLRGVDLCVGYEEIDLVLAAREWRREPGQEKLT